MVHATYATMKTHKNVQKKANKDTEHSIISELTNKLVFKSTGLQSFVFYLSFPPQGENFELKNFVQSL